MRSWFLFDPRGCAWNSAQSLRWLSWLRRPNSARAYIGSSVRSLWAHPHSRSPHAHSAECSHLERDGPRRVVGDARSSSYQILHHLQRHSQSAPFLPPWLAPLQSLKTNIDFQSPGKTSYWPQASFRTQRSSPVSSLDTGFWESSILTGALACSHRTITTSFSALQLYLSSC